MADAAERTNAIVEFLSGVDALSEWQRVSIVEELHLALARLAIVDSADTGILLVEPRALNISLLLWVVPLGIELADKVRDLMCALVLEWTCVTASKSRSLLLVISDSLAGIRGRLLTEVVTVFSAEVAGTFSLIVARNDSTKARVGRLDRTIDERKFSDVVLVDHAQNRFLLAHMDLRVLNFLLVGRLKFPLHKKE